MANPSYFDEAARERQKKSTMACEMCRKRKVLHPSQEVKDADSTGEMYLQRPLTSNLQLLCQILVPVRRQHSSQTTRATTTGNRPIFPTRLIGIMYLISENG